MNRINKNEQAIGDGFEIRPRTPTTFSYILYILYIHVNV